MAVQPPYAELTCITNFTFLAGASHPQELVARAAELGYEAIAITDECSLAGVVRALEEQQRCRQRGQAIRLIPGSSFRLENGSRLVLLPADHAGYAQLCTLITRGRRHAPKGEYRLPDSAFEQSLDRCLAVWLPAAEDDRLTAHWLAAYFPGRCWLGIGLNCGPDDRRRLARLLALAQSAGIPATACGDVRMHARSRRMLHDVLAAIRHGCPVADLGYRALPSGERHLRTRDRFAELFPAELLAESVTIARRCEFRLEQLHYRYPREVVPKGKTPTEHLRDLVELGIQERWGQSKNSLPAENPDRFVTNFYSDPCHPPASISPRLRAQIEKELELIAELHYEPYFLTVYDIVRFARSQGILCQGRGSAANSAVCYCLGITEVDPARMNMLFERFISRDRDEPPDIDVDFEHERREEVIQYIYRKYGRGRAALAATVISYRPKSAIRDVAKALGFSLAQADLLARNTAWWDDPEGFAERIAGPARKLHEPPTAAVRKHAPGWAPGQALTGSPDDNLKVRHLVHLVQAIVGFPRHLSQHVGGFVISDGPLAELVPVENAAMADRTVIQWDKEDLETLGMLKVDCLALGMLTAIHRCLDLIRGQSKNSLRACGDSSTTTNFYSDPTLANIPPEDPETYAMIQRADTVGVFQIESRAQMAMLPRLRPACFYDLVIEVAIVRPGPIQGNMVHPYLQRRCGLEQVEYPSEELKAVLERTLGVPIFQEQVMQIAMVAAGFSGSEADVLRRSMAAWARRGGLEHVHDRLVGGMRERGYSEDFAEQIFNQIKGFGEYGFPESHAASFALLVYVSCWLKCHHPAAFTCALLNSQPMGFYQPSQLVQDAQRHGVKVLPAEVRYSDWDCTLERKRGQSTNSLRARRNFSPTPNLYSDPKPLPDPTVRLGLRMIKGMRKATAERIVAARCKGPFRDVQDLANRAALDRRDLAVLAEAAALRGLAGHRHRARWEVAAVEKPKDDLLRGTDPCRRPRATASLPYSLRSAQNVRSLSPALAADRAQARSYMRHRRCSETAVTIRPPTEADDIRADFASTGLTLGRHPVALIRPQLKRRRARTAEELHALPHGSRVRACGIITMRQRPATASGTIFLTLEDETGCVNAVIWPRLFDRQRAEILGATLLAVDGVVEKGGEIDGEVLHLIADRVHDFSDLAEGLAPRSRDFC